MSQPPHLRATYRLQLEPGFDLRAATAIVPYLADLGVSHLYLSPIWAARPGSTHGYDVVDHAAIRPELGGPQAFADLAQTAANHGLGLIVDCVPNHMGVGYSNPWWRDVLTWGEGSPYADYFDIDWRPAEPTLRGRVLLPILGDHYGRALEEGDLRPALDGGSFIVRYHEHSVPLHPRDAGELLDVATGAARERADDAAADALADLAANARLIAKSSQRTSRQRRRADRDRALQIANRLAGLRHDNAAIDDCLAAALEHFTPKSPADGDGKAADRLHRLLERQAYRLAFWRLAAHEINYRRFFDINDLAGLRMEETPLFDAAHRLVLELVQSGAVHGLRLDHIDGLLDPQAYLLRLRRQARAPEGPTLSIHVEKIVASGEDLRDDWPVDGTTGYEVLNLIHGLQVEPEARAPLLRLYEELTDPPRAFAAECIAAKRLIMQTSLAAELSVLAGDLNRIAKRSRLTRDYARPALREALANVVAHFPVYRTYVGQKGATDADRAVIARAVAGARHAATTPDLSIYDFIADALTGDLAHTPPRGLRAAEVKRFARRFQQYTGPVTAKAVEDTAFYRWVPFVSLNEVGGEPDHFGTRTPACHPPHLYRLDTCPRPLGATATHDHKRGEDTRARLAVLSERAQAWGSAVRRWFRLAEPLIAATEDGPAPSPNDLYLAFQTIVGAWPIGLRADDATGLAAYRDRLQGYMTKAIREAKVRTSWAVNHAAYEMAVADFVDAVLDREQAPRLVDELQAFAAELDRPGAVNGLAQTVLKLTIPGVPDIYQGTEGWDLSLVDPDNRRPIDYARHADDLAAIAGGTPLATLTEAWADGRIKQAVVASLLASRRADPELYLEGDYRPLTVEGALADRVVAFARTHGERAVAVVVPRLVADNLDVNGPLAIDWGDTVVDAAQMTGEGRSWRCVFSSAALAGDGRFGLAETAAALPVLVATTGTDA